MLKMDKVLKLSDGSFMVGFADEDSDYAVLTLRLTEENIQKLHNAIIK